LHQCTQCPRQGFDHHIVAIVDQLITDSQRPHGVSIATARTNIQRDSANKRKPSLPSVS
jgi:hypothetical protein